MTEPQDTPVSWRVDDITVNASLTRPDGAGPFPAVIMVAGSGPTDRDWNTPLLPGTNGSAALLARVLTDAGLVTLRYDKSASGPNRIENAKRLTGKVSMQSHMRELAGGVHLLAARPDVDRAEIFALTNSEGCIHALNYQIQSADLHFAGMILTSAPARPVGAVGRSQIAAQLAAVPGGDKILAAYDEAIRQFSAGQQMQIDESLPEGIRMLLQSLAAPMNLPFARELWVADVTRMLPRVQCPVLILLGKKDVQVVSQSEGPIFEELAKQLPNVQVAYAENANHVLKHEPKAMSELNPAEIGANYNAESARLDPQVVEVILSWLKAQM